MEESDFYADSRQKASNNVKTVDSRGFALIQVVDQNNADNHVDVSKELKAKNLKEKEDKPDRLEERAEPKRKTKKDKKKTKPAKKVKKVVVEEQEIPDTVVDNCLKVYKDNKSLKDKINKLKNEMNDKVVSHEKNNLLNEKMKNNYELLLEENNLLKQKMIRMEKSVIELKTINSDINTRSMSEVHLKMENESLRFENKKLFEMLKKTKEYQDFGNDYDKQHSLSYLRNLNIVSNKKDSNYLKVKINNTENVNKGNDAALPALIDMYVDGHKYRQSEGLYSDVKTSSNDIDELDRWVPSNTYKFMKEIQREQNLSDSLIEYILYELNQIWSKREKDIVKFFKKHGKSSRKLLKSEQLPLDDKDKLITKLRTKITNLEAKLKSFKSNRNTHEAFKNNELLTQNLKQFQHRSKEFRKTNIKLNFIEKANNHLNHILDKNRLRKYYNIEGESKMSNKLGGVIAELKKEVISFLEANYEQLMGVTGDMSMKERVFRNKKRIDDKLRDIDKTLRAI